MEPQLNNWLKSRDIVAVSWLLTSVFVSNFERAITLKVKWKISGVNANDTYLLWHTYDILISLSNLKSEAITQGQVQCWSSRLPLFCRIAILKDFAKFIRTHRQWSPIFSKVTVSELFFQSTLLTDHFWILLSCLYYNLNALIVHSEHVSVYQIRVSVYLKYVLHKKKCRKSSIILVYITLTVQNLTKI